MGWSSVAGSIRLYLPARPCIPPSLSCSAAAKYCVQVYLPTYLPLRNKKKKKKNSIEARPGKGPPANPSRPLCTYRIACTWYRFRDAPLPSCKPWEDSKKKNKKKKKTARSRCRVPCLHTYSVQCTYMSTYGTTANLLPPGHRCTHGRGERGCFAFAPKGIREIRSVPMDPNGFLLTNASLKWSITVLCTVYALCLCCCFRGS